MGRGILKECKGGKYSLKHGYWDYVDHYSSLKLSLNKVNKDTFHIQVPETLSEKTISLHQQGNFNLFNTKTNNKNPHQVSKKKLLNMKLTKIGERGRRDEEWFLPYKRGRESQQFFAYQNLNNSPFKQNMRSIIFHNSVE